MAKIIDVDFKQKKRIFSFTDEHEVERVKKNSRIRYLLDQTLDAIKDRLPYDNTIHKVAATAFNKINEYLAKRS